MRGWSRDSDIPATVAASHSHCCCSVGSTFGLVGVPLFDHGFVLLLDPLALTLLVELVEIHRQVEHLLVISPGWVLCSSSRQSDK